MVTNGTIPLPDWRDVNWYISIDGDEEVHDHLRDKRGAYQRALRNLRRSRHLGITIAYCITRQNAHCIERVVADWHAAGAKHITFDFYTPIAGGRRRAVGPLRAAGSGDRQTGRACAAVYGDFFVIPERVMRLMRSDSCRERHRQLPAPRSRSFALDASGRSKGKCVMGEKADCDRCGCVVPYYLRAITDRRLILQDIGRDLLSGFRATLRQEPLSPDLPRRARRDGDHGRAPF